MAEEALYRNVSEPKFPFELVAKKLGSLIEDLESANRSGSYNAFPSMLNTVLVWARARTATWWTNDVYGINETLVSSLNAILEEVGANATYHRLELVPRFNMFFVTCRNSPRFNWSTRPTHLEIGQNLDFFAPSHVFKDTGPSGGRLCVQYLERSTGRPLTIEKISFDVLYADPACLERLKQFCDRKETLFNNTMEQLGLKYRFKYQMIYPNHSQIIQLVMCGSVPPTLEWWEENFFVLNNPDGIVIIQWCRFESNFRDNWELICYVYSFLLKNICLETCQMFERCANEQWERFGAKIEEVHVALTQPFNAEKSESLFTDLRREFSEFVVTADTLRKTSGSDGKNSKVSLYRRLHCRVTLSIRWVWFALRAFSQDIRIHLFEQWKLRKPLVWKGGLMESDGPLCQAHEWGY